MEKGAPATLVDAIYDMFEQTGGQCSGCHKSLLLRLFSGHCVCAPAYQVARSFTIACIDVWFVAEE